MIKRPTVDELLADSLLELLQEAPLSSISVRRICENCGLSVRTFYNNYRDKNELVKKIYYELSEKCWYQDGQLVTLQQYLDNCVAHYSHTYRKFFLNVYTYTGQNSIREVVHDKCVSDLCRLMMHNGYGAEICEDIRRIFSFFVYGVIAFCEIGNTSDAMVDQLLGWFREGVCQCVPHSVYHALMYPKSFDKEIF